MVLYLFATAITGSYDPPAAAAFTATIGVTTTTLTTTTSGPHSLQSIENYCTYKFSSIPFSMNCRTNTHALLQPLVVPDDGVEVG